MTKPYATAGEWAKSVAASVVQDLLDTGIIPQAQFDVASEVVAEQLFCRLCMNHYPPPVDRSNIEDAKSVMKRRRG
jgi:hypothetical protein